MARLPRTAHHDGQIDPGWLPDAQGDLDPLRAVVCPWRSDRDRTGVGADGQPRRIRRQAGIGRRAAPRRVGHGPGRTDLQRPVQRTVARSPLGNWLAKTATANTTSAVMAARVLGLLERR